MSRGYVLRLCCVYFVPWRAATQVLGGLMLTPFGGTQTQNPNPEPNNVNLNTNREQKNAEV